MKAITTAIIDCGTNTFHLMLVSITGKDFTIISSEKQPVKIGEGGIEKRLITGEASRRALSCIRSFSDKIRANDVKEVHAFATSAFRNATNGQDLRNRIEEETGISINIIDGEREAELIYAGVNLALDLGDETSLIMDIGGGSVEFIIGTRHGVQWKRSFEIGAQRLLDKFFPADPIPPESILLLEGHLRETLQPLSEAITMYRPKRLIGASGTFDTLSDMHCLRQGVSMPEASPELPLTIESYRFLHEEIISSNRQERLAIPGMVEMRVDMIVVASCLITYMLKICPVSEIRVSSYALKEGVLAGLVNH